MDIPNLTIDTLFYPVLTLYFPGLDNAFVILNSWHRSDKKASMEDRLGDTMSEAGVSILITSLTDIISFYTAVSSQSQASIISNRPMRCL